MSNSRSEPKIPSFRQSLSSTKMVKFIANMLPKNKFTTIKNKFAFIKKLRRFPLKFVLKKKYNECVEQVLSFIYRTALAKLTFYPGRQCDARNLSKIDDNGQPERCKHPNKLGYPYCEYHSNRRIDDHQNYHLMGAFRQRQSLAIAYADDFENAPPAVYEYWEDLEQGRDEAYYAANELYLRLIYAVRYNLTSDYGHQVWESNLRLLFNTIYTVDLDGIRPYEAPTPPASFYCGSDYAPNLDIGKDIDYFDYYCNCLEEGHNFEHINFDSTSDASREVAERWD